MEEASGDTVQVYVCNNIIFVWDVWHYKWLLSSLHNLDRPALQYRK